MELKRALASVCIGGEYYPIQAGLTTVGNLKINLVLENKAENLYSWVVYLENDSDENSPRITNLYGLDTTVSVSGRVAFNTLRGDDRTVYSFYPEYFSLADGEKVTRAPVGGRSSNTTAFPYFDMEDAQGNGLVCGIGWSGQWKLDVTRNGDQVRLLAGFQDCDFYLEPHEKVRSIRILLYVGSGGEDKLRHCFVRLHREFYSPVPRIEKDTFFPVSFDCWGRYCCGTFKEGEVNPAENEEAQLLAIKKAAECKQFNTFWMDACWFDGAFPPGVGNYTYGKGFPQGLKKIGEQAAQNGMRFLLWFEPVRALMGTELCNIFPSDGKKLIALPNDDLTRLVNLGDSEVWQYQFEQISKIIAENNVKIYRQDFNINPYDFLRSIEPEGRVGMAQIRFVEGIYKLWDALLARFPGLMIDNCASGGRLLDVETNMRAIPLHRSDMMGRPSPLASQNEILGLSKYIPYQQGGAFDYTPYFLRSAMTTGICCPLSFLPDARSVELEKETLRFLCRKECFQVSEITNMGPPDLPAVEKALDDAISLREYWNGDFTALTPPADHKKAIVAYSLHLEEAQRGVVLVFRREEADDTFTVKLPNVLPDKDYALTFSDEDRVETEAVVAGKQLLEGLPVSFTKAPASLLIRYQSH